MNAQNQDELYYRRLAFKLFEKGKSPKQILAQIPRKRSWLFKWKRRFEEHGWQALEGLSKAPHRCPHAYAASTKNLVLRVRQKLEQAAVGLVGARAIRHHLQHYRLVKVVPSGSSIKRWLRAAGLRGGESPTDKEPYYPVPRLGLERVFFSLDWLARYLEGGQKLFVFHTIDHASHALWQSVDTAKTTRVACAHLVESCCRVGVPDFLQIDNDAAFTGLGRNKGSFGQFVRLCLYFGIEPVFIPPAEPKRNGLVEGVNGLWARSFFAKNHFASVPDFLRKRYRFLRWYEDYAPPALQGLSVSQARRQRKRHKLTRKQVQHVPAPLPLSEGRVHFIRKVDQRGCVNILKERWRISKSLVGEYVWATIDLQRRSLQIYHRRSHRAQTRLVKSHEYRIKEKVTRLPPEYRRRKRRVKVLQII